MNPTSPLVITLAKQRKRNWNDTQSLFATSGQTNITICIMRKLYVIMVQFKYTINIFVCIYQ